jgi:hypothetical protein
MLYAPLLAAPAPLHRHGKVRKRGHVVPVVDVLLALCRVCGL